MMKNLLFDTGPLISLTTNNLLWALKQLKQAYQGNFYITKASQYELIGHPLATKRFKFEALQIMEMIQNKTLEVIDSTEIKQVSLQLLDAANHCYSVNKKNMIIVQHAEMQCLAAAALYQADAIAVDERTTRLLLEDPQLLKSILSKKLNVKIDLNQEMLAKFRNILRRDIKVIRSAELVTVAYELGILDRFLADIPEARRALLDGILWGVKLHGCSVSTREIEQILKLEKV